MCGTCPGGVHNPHDEDGVVFENPWMWKEDDLLQEASVEEVVDTELPGYIRV